MDELMSAEQVAAMFPGKSVRWVMDKLVRAKRVDVVKIGGSRWIVKSSLVRMMELQTRHGFRAVR